MDPRLLPIILRSPLSRDALWRTAQQVPAFDLDFTSGTPVNRGSLAAGNLGTFTRPSSVKLVWNGTQYVEVPADTPALQLDPVSGLWGVLMEPAAATNLCLQSARPGTTPWTLIGISAVESAQSSPFGSSTVTTLTEDSANSVHIATLPASVTSGTTYTASAVVKLGVGARFATLLFTASGFGVNAGVSFDLVSGVIAGSNDAGNVASITPLSGGYYRVTFTRTATASVNTSLQVRLTNVSDNYLGPHQGDGASSLVVAHVQLETGPVATSPIITAGSAVTRAADSMAVSGADFSRWFVPGGVLYGEFTPNELLAGTIASIDDGTASHRVQLRFMQSGGLRARYRWVSPSSNLDQLATNAISGVTSKMALSCGLDRSGASDGIAYDPGPTATLPTVTRMTVGSAVGSDSSPVAIHRITYFPPGPAQSRLQQLTAA